MAKLSLFNFFEAGNIAPEHAEAKLSLVVQTFVAVRQIETL